MTEPSKQEAPVIRETGPNPDLTIIWMHGLGADGNDFVPVIPELGLPAGAAVRFIFPHALQMPVTWNNGYVMRSWFDIIPLDGGIRRADQPSLLASRERVRQLIAEERAKGTPAARIVLAGFSQGGAMAYTVAMTNAERLGGIIALSTFMPVQALVEAEFVAANQGLPVFAAHGSEDAVLTLAQGEQARDVAKAAGLDVQWHVYPMPHSVCMEELVDIGAWLRAQFFPAN